LCQSRSPLTLTVAVLGRKGGAGDGVGVGVAVGLGSDVRLGDADGVAGGVLVAAEGGTGSGEASGGAGAQPTMIRARNAVGRRRMTTSLRVGSRARRSTTPDLPPVADQGRVTSRFAGDPDARTDLRHPPPTTMSSDECAFNENPLKVRGGRRRLSRETGGVRVSGHRRQLYSALPEVNRI
jgi:hypothetical protein